ncbi:MAG: hypothetical protein SOY65_08495 [Marinifilaceae bacterium]|nr:hypothetical protein [Marinifilaceae bacterium]
MRLLLIFLLLVAASRSWAQADTTRVADSVAVVPEVDFLQKLLEPDSLTGARVTIHADPRLEELVRLRKSVYKRRYEFTGYRIQLLSVSSYMSNVDSLEAFCERFREEFPEYRVYLQYFDPDFKIRVGNFRSRIESLPALVRIREKYPRAYPVKCSITVRELMPEVQADTVRTDSIGLLPVVPTE